MRIKLNLLTTLIALLTHSIVSLSAKSTRPRIPVIAYFDDWVCIDKPFGLTVHRSKGTPKHKPVLTTSVKRQLARKVYPVHRLDHRTSGAILMAFDSSTAGRLHEAAIKKGNKAYIALVRGEWDRPEETIIVDKPLNVNNITKDAVTKFTLLATTETGHDDRSSLVLCQPLTGRTHQIRRHAYAIGHPIIGDSQHGDSRVNRWWRENKGLNRLALHSWKLDFSFDSQNHELIAPLSLEFQDVLKSTVLWNEAIQKEPRLEMAPIDNRSGTHGRNYRNKNMDEEETFTTTIS